ncbi:MAG TPA: hypothetical protein VNM67_03270 [Thermoanaerobaculia bacterium]|jgi:hypothetical protein|nr:hypothetical protein [Thermoanaerobaculia bacterium]
MADLSYFLKNWTVTDGSGQLTKYLPAKGSTVKIEAQQNGSSKTFRIAPAGRSRIKPREGFKYLKGRLELSMKDANCVLVIEQEDRADGIPRLKASIEPRAKGKGIKHMPGTEMSGTWGAETNPPGGGGGGGKG